MEIITFKRLYCPHCNSDDLIKKGFTKDGRQRYKCFDCKKSFTEDKRPMGSPLFNKEKLLNFMNDDTYNFNKEVMYSLGLLVADGSISKTNQMSITLKEEDAYILNHVKNGLGINNTIRNAKCGRQNKIYKRLTWGYKHSYPYWERVGMIHNKTGNEIWLPYMENFHFLRGYLDGDGCIYKNRIIFNCGSLEFLQQLQRWLQNYTDNLGSLCKGHGCFTLSYSGKDMNTICELIYNDSDNLRLERKYNKWS